MTSIKTRAKTEYGDFQTPEALALQVCVLLQKDWCDPRIILEPNCGVGYFLSAAIHTFPNLDRLIGVEVNQQYVRESQERIQPQDRKIQAQIIQADFFTHSWDELISSFEEPFLILGNPPWVTNATLGRLDSGNIPEKSNFQKLRGLDAVTGKSNFDISEWMLMQELRWIAGKNAMLAMLVKTTVARKVLLEAWRHRMQIGHSAMYKIDALHYFSAAVDACLLVVPGSKKAQYECHVYESLVETEPSSSLGFSGRYLVADMATFRRYGHLSGKDNHYRWRSGIKHDASSIMELLPEGDRFKNGLGEVIELEEDYLYPMYKSSEVANGDQQTPKRWMLVPQKVVGDGTREIEWLAPKTWQYLMVHAELLDERKSSIYRNRPRFSIFGVGDYTFAPWKVAISGFYKKLHFVVYGPYMNRPVVFDDTCYFLACETRAEAEFLAELLGSDAAKDFYSAFIFWDTKRPITISLLKRLNLRALARSLGLEDQYRHHMRRDIDENTGLVQMKFAL